MSAVREAILEAADTIEQNPHLWDFKKASCPRTPHSSGCAIGWIGTQLGYAGRGIGMVFDALKIRADSQFYLRIEYIHMTQLGHYVRIHVMTAPQVAQCMRIYADRYHPVERFGMPESIRSIFATLATA